MAQPNAFVGQVSRGQLVNKLPTRVANNSHRAKTEARAFDFNLAASNVAVRLAGMDQIASITLVCLSHVFENLFKFKKCENFNFFFTICNEKLTRFKKSKVKFINVT